jgi:hypothetical protein
MTDAIPKVHRYTQLEGLLEEVQRSPAKFRLRLITDNYAKIVELFSNYCPTSTDRLCTYLFRTKRFLPRVDICHSSEAASLLLPGGVIYPPLPVGFFIRCKKTRRRYEG